eukprot:gene21291-biopygen14678
MPKRRWDRPKRRWDRPKRRWDRPKSTANDDWPAPAKPRSQSREPLEPGRRRRTPPQPRERKFAGLGRCQAGLHARTYPPLAQEGGAQETFL